MHALREHQKRDDIMAAQQATWSMLSMARAAAAEEKREAKKAQRKEAKAEAKAAATAKAAAEAAASNATNRKKTKTNRRRA